MDATLRNAEIEGVADRITLETADMTALPFPDNSFDVVVSSLAIHNIHSVEGRKKQFTRHIAWQSQVVALLLPTH